MRVDKLIFTSERWGHLGTAPLGRSLSERPRLLYLDPSFLTDFCGPETFLPLGAPFSIRNTLKSYFITVSYGYKCVSVVYKDIFLELKAYFFLLILKDIETLARPLGTVPAVPNE